MSRKPYTCVLFNGKYIETEYRMPDWLPVIRVLKPISLARPFTYSNDFNKIESWDYEFVGELPDGRLLYARSL